MEWNEPAILLSVQPHGENGLIAQTLTRTYGRHAGYVSGGNSKRQRAIFQPGNCLDVIWRGRLSEQLGNFSCESRKSHAANVLDDPIRLAALNSAMTVIASALPEREPHGNLFDSVSTWLEGLEGGYWGETLVLLEIQLLSVLGFGLDLSSCAATGVTSDLCYISPRSGRAVSREAAEPYKSRLLKLPGFLVGMGSGEQDVLDGLLMTGYFLERHVFHPHNKPLPVAHSRLTDRIQRNLPLKEVQ
jgi:DNA repair protein RecO (recombination protein O)